MSGSDGPFLKDRLKWSFWSAYGSWRAYGRLRTTGEEEEGPESGPLKSNVVMWSGSYHGTRGAERSANIDRNRLLGFRQGDTCPEGASEAPFSAHAFSASSTPASNSNR